VSLLGMRSSTRQMERDFGFSVPLVALVHVNQVSPATMVDVASHHVHTWKANGTAPPSHPRIEFGGDTPQIVRDGSGITRGGTRHYEVEVPFAHNSAIEQTPDLFARLLGYNDAFPVEKVEELYGSRERYLELYAVVPRDTDAPIEEARANCPL